MRYKKLEINCEQIYNKFQEEVLLTFERGIIMNTLKTIATAQKRLCYSLTESVREDGSISYGVKAATTLFGTSEEAAVEDISSDRQVVEKFVDLLADNLVLPSTLTEVAEEFVASFFTV